MTSTASYAIDAGGTILWTDEGFAAAARAHGRPNLADEAVGRPLLEFVAGERPQALQQALIERARRAAEPLELRYRCDAPEARRHAIIRIAPQPGGGIVFSTWFEAVEKRPRQVLLDPDAPRSGDVVMLCAWCNRVDIGGWREADDVAGRAAHSGTTPPRVDHTVCDVCELLLTTRPAAGPRWSGPRGPE